MELFYVSLVGAFAQLSDGTLGFGFGIISSSMLVIIGTSALSASATIHFAELGTTFVSGLSHWRYKNIDSRFFLQLAIPGGVGAFLGATLLSNIYLPLGNIILSTILIFLGVSILLRPIFKSVLKVKNTVEIYPNKMRFLGLIGGLLDSVGGGGWGAVVSPVLIGTTRIDPRKIIGTVSASEFVVAVSASFGFILNFSKLELDLGLVLALSLGGIVVAPFAAKIVSVISKKWLTIFIGLGVILINLFKGLT